MTIYQIAHYDWECMRDDPRSWSGVQECFESWKGASDALYKEFFDFYKDEHEADRPTFQFEEVDDKTWCLDLVDEAYYIYKVEVEK